MHETRSGGERKAPEMCYCLPIGVWKVLEAVRCPAVAIAVRLRGFALGPRPRFRLFAYRARNTLFDLYTTCANLYMLLLSSPRVV